MRRLPRFAVRLVLPLALLAPRAAAPAEEPPRLKTQVVKLKLAADGPPRSDRQPTIELVQLPPGKVTLKGADGKGREHEIKPLWMSRYETRWEEYRVFYAGFDLSDADAHASNWRAERVLGPLRSVWPEGHYDGASPAGSIHFRAARKYCAWLSKHTGRKFRLPTEAEWEYACRAGGGPVRPDAKALDRVAWFAGNSGDKLHPVGQKEPNAWGLYDMLGNVGEYVVRDPKDEKGLLAGGSYKAEPADVHCGAREPYSPEWQRWDPQEPKDTDWLLDESAYHVGFRVVMEE